MKLIEYMQKKYKGKANALSSPEAMILGIEYPLRAGWIRRHGDMEITREHLQGIYNALARRGSVVDNQSLPKIAQMMRDVGVPPATSCLDVYDYLRARARSGKFTLTDEECDVLGIDMTAGWLGRIDGLRVTPSDMSAILLRFREKMPSLSRSQRKKYALAIREVNRMLDSAMPVLRPAESRANIAA